MLITPTPPSPVEGGGENRWDEGEMGRWRKREREGRRGKMKPDSGAAWVAY